MPNVNKNLVIGGVDVHLKQHGEKGYRVKESVNLRYNNGHILGTPALITFAGLVAAGTVNNYDSIMSNQILSQ